MKISGLAPTEWLAHASPWEALMMALLMERGAMATYRRLAALAGTPANRAKFRFLAEQEREHARIVAEAMTQTPKPAAAPKFARDLTEVRGAFEEDGPARVVAWALKQEHQMEKYYLACGRLCRGTAGREMFKWLAGQEARHAEILDAELALLRSEYVRKWQPKGPPAESDFWSHRE